MGVEQIDKWFHLCSSFIKYREYLFPCFSPLIRNFLPFFFMINDDMYLSQSTKTPQKTLYYLRQQNHLTICAALFFFFNSCNEWISYFIFIFVKLHISKMNLHLVNLRQYLKYICQDIFLSFVFRKLNSVLHCSEFLISSISKQTD